MKAIPVVYPTSIGKQVFTVIITVLNWENALSEVVVKGRKFSTKECYHIDYEATRNLQKKIRESINGSTDNLEVLEVSSRVKKLLWKNPIEIEENEEYSEHKEYKTC